MPTQATLRMTAAMRGGGTTTAGMPAVTRLMRGAVAASAELAACVPIVDPRPDGSSVVRGGY